MTLKILDKELPCECGHTKYVHTNHFNMPICEGCANYEIKQEFRHSFKLDNLAYVKLVEKSKAQEKAYRLAHKLLSWNNVTKTDSST